MTHGLGGSVIDFFQVVKHMEVQNPIYGMQAKGIDGVEEPFDSVEEMAQFYLDAIHQVQPHGPYFLIGYSLGGLVTLEMSHRLLQSGEDVALLAMLDAYPHMRHLSAVQRVRLLIRLTKRRASAALRMPIRDVLSYIVQAPERRFRTPRDQRGRIIPESPTMQRAREKAFLALRRYQPRFYNGKIRFIKAQISSDFPDDPVAVWAKLANEFDLESVPGDHLGIMTTHFETLAFVLCRCLRETAVCKQGRD
jgi:acetoacetyl-CoA synthetase